MSKKEAPDDNRRWLMYVVKCNDDTLYTGITTDVERRIGEHNHSKKGAKYTAARRPVEIIFSKIFPGQSLATKAENRFKKLRRADKLKIINGEKEFPLLSE
jgi:putative endonuclease